MLRNISLRFVQRSKFKCKTNFYKDNILDSNLEVATGTLSVEVELDIVEFMITVSINPMLCYFLLHRYYDSLDLHLIFRNIIMALLQSFAFSIKSNSL